MVVGRPSFVSYLRRPISLLNCLRRGQKKRQSREKLRSYVSTYSTAEQLEDRTLLAGASLVNIEPNIDLSLTDGEVYNQAPSELTFKFTPGQQINPDTLGAIQIVRSGLDGTFTDGNEVPITPGYIGIGENPNEVILRFAESLPDDHYQITILGTGANPLLNQNDEAFQDGVDQVIDFELDLGAKVVAVVPQPVSGGGTGSLTQAKDQIDVYFNSDTLDQASAENVQFYQLIDTSSNTLINPDSVIYDSATNKATLTFAADIADGTYHLRIGESNTPDFTTASVVAVGDVNSSFDEADANADLGVLGTQTIQVNGEIQPQSVLQPQLPGGNDEPGHREITIEQHIESNATGTTPSAPSAIPTIQFYFPDFYGNDLYGNPLYNEITENQKQRTREIYELYSFLTGIEVQETANSGTAIVTGDIRVLDPGTPPLAVGGIAGGGMAIMNGALDWGDSPYGGGWFGTAFHEIGHTLGLGHSYDLPSVMGSSGGDVGGTVAGEPIFPSNYDITHINRIHPALANDIDLHKFELATAGRFTAEITADRLPTKSFLDSVLTLYKETSPGVREIIARNDDFFGEDAFLDLELEAGNYYLAVTSVGNIDFDPNVADSGYGGRTDGLYSLDINFTPDPMANTFMVDSTGVALDGDADGTPGGVFDFWFQSGETIFVDKATQSAGPADGSLSNPYANIDDALLAAGNSATAKIVRIVGNGGVDGDISTLADNDAYLVGLTDSFQPLEDGATFNIPKDVTVMVDEGVIIKLQRANIDVGSNNLQDDRSQGALQILGTTENQVYLTAFGNDAIGGDDDGLSDGANPGDWGGIVFRDDSGLEDQGIFLNSVNNANISYGGGSVFVNSVQQVFSAIHAESARPTIWQNTIAFSADSAISADPRSFEDSQFTNGSFVMDRHGLEIFDNHIANNSVNGLFVRINTPYGSTINKLDVPAIFNDKITHVITENLQIYGAPGGQMDESGNPTINGRLKIDPGTVIKLSGARIEAERGSAQLIAEGTEANPIIFTSLSDDRYGAGTTFDTSNDGFDTSDPANLPYGPGNWGGIIFNAASSGSIDHALITNAGGLIPIEGGFANFNAIEVHQAEFRISNSILENNASGQTGSSRNGRGSNDDATIFVRGAQPIIVDNIFRDNEGTVVSIDANSLNYKFKGDYGRSTGFTEAYTQYTDNHGALVRLNRMENNGLNGMEVREALLDTETVWDDTDIVHILRGEIQVLQHHTFSGIRLQSNLDEGLVVKLDGADAGFTADGVPLDIEDRIGGTVQIIGQPGFPVILTSLADDTAGASFTPAGLPQTDTNNDGDASTPSAGDWRSIRLDRYSNDRNVVERFETEGNNTGGVDTNSNPGFAQNLGILAPDEISGDENRALGFNVHGNISADAPDDVDVYSFTGTAGTRIWIDIDRTSSALDTMVELVDLYGNVLARSLNSFDDLTLSGDAQSLLQDEYLLGDFYSQNINDAGFSVVLPGPAGATGTFFIRVRSQPVAGDEANLEGGQTSGQYQLQVRLRQVDEKPGSTVRYADIRYPTNGVEVLGQPAHSPLLGESSEKTANNESIDNAQGLGNLLTSDRNTLSVSGSLSNGSDVDWYTFEMGYDLVQVIGGRSDGGKTFAAIFDIDYADGLSRGDTTLSVFDDQGRLILVSRDSDIQDDQADGDTENLAAGSFGKLDPYIGTVQLPSATPGSTFRYHVAISSNARLPQAMNATFVSGALNSQIRLEPVSSVQRIVEDHIGFSGYTSGNSLAGSTYVVPPTTSSIFDISNETTLSTNVTAFTLEDVNLYVSQNDRLRIVDPYDGRVAELYPGANATIDVGALSTGGNDNTADITIRSDGRLFSYESLSGVGNTVGRYREIDPGNAGTISSNNDGIPSIPNTGATDPVQINSDSVGALAFQRIGVATYNLFYAVNDGANTTLYQANPANGDAGDNRWTSSTDTTDPRNTFTVIGDITGYGNITGMSFRGINASASQSILYAVTDDNYLLTITFTDRSWGRRDVNNVTAVDLSGQISGTLQGLTAAPQNLNNGAFQNYLFGITNTGNLYCIDPATGSLLSTIDDPALGTINIFNGGGNFINVGASGITGLAFSPLDFNLWHPTFRRNTDSGHGINNTFDQTRTDVGGNDRDTFPNGLEQSEQQGGASFYFGFEQWLVNNSSTNDYIDYEPNAQYGVLDSDFQRDLSTNPNIGDNYNIAGGAHGSLVSGEFSLAGYNGTDLPTLYFNYFLETENANSITGNMRDAARVYITNDGGTTWEELATNNSTLAPATNPNSGELSSYLTVSEREGVGNANQQVQEMFDNSGVWRQARIDLSNYAGDATLQLRFDFSTSGTVEGENVTTSSPITPPVSDYQIDVLFTDSSLTASQQAVFQQAAYRWSQIIQGDVPDVDLSSMGYGIVDDLVIEATAPSIDGVGGILGQAGPTSVRPGTFIPSSGIMQFDSADIADMEASGRLFDVILHEMGHVLGIGTIWDDLGLVTDLGTSDPRYTGTEGVTQYNALLGTSLPDIPVANTGGSGTFGSHWRESDLDTELMTGYAEPAGVNMPISTITIGSLADLGYDVDLGAADTYPLQAPDSQTEGLVSLGEMLEAPTFLVLDESSILASANDSSLSSLLPGDLFGDPDGNRQAQNNNFEGFYIDDIIIGFAERGEMVTGAQADQTAFFNLPQNPTFGAPTQLLSGGYQLEIRRGTEYAAPPNGQLPDLTISTQFDTNDRLIREVEATVPSDFLNGQQGDRNLARQQGHISIESNSISSASEYGINIDAGQRESVAAGPNGGVSARSQAGGVINVPELNDFFNGGLGFAPGVTIQNNVVTEFTNGLGGIRVSGDANSSTQNNPAAVSYTKVVNNTLSGANVTVTQSSAQIDVVFIIDISGSMGPAIANVQAQLLNFNSQMQAAGIDAQYGLVLMPSPVGFSDDPTQVQDIVDFATFTAPGSPFLTIPITGATERGSDAILEALNLFDPDAGPTTFNYRPGSRIVPILLTNEDDDSTTQAAIDAQAALLSTNSLFYAIADPLFFNTASTYGTFATSTGGQLFDINNFLLDPTNFFNTMTADLIGQIAVGAAGQGILVENYATTTILNNIVANTSTAIDLQSSGGIPNVVGANVFKGNTAIGTAGTNSIQLGANDPLFVNPSKGNYYLADNSQAIDSSLNSLADRPDFVNVKDSIGMPNSDIFAPTYDAFGQLRVDDPTQTPPPGLGSNIFKDRGAIERADFVGPTAIISLPEDNDVDGVDQNSDPNAVYITNPELFTTMIVKLKDSGIGIDDSLVNSLQFTLTARTSTSTRTLEEGLDYIFSYNRNTDEVIFTSIAGVFGMDTLYTIDVDNSTTNAVKDLAGNVLQPNQTDGSTSFTILVSDGVNAPPINHFDATPIPDSPNVTVTTDPGFSVVFSAANGNALTVTDQDSFLGTQGIPTSPATDGMVTVTLSTLMTEGKLAAGPNTSNVTINLTDDGTSYFLEITGLIEDVNTALDGVSWTPLSTPTDGSTFAGATASLTMTTDDNGNFFGDPSQTDTDVIDIVVTALPEVFFNTPTYSLNEDGTTTVTVELERDKIGLETTVDLLFGAGDTEGIDFTTPPPAQVIFAANELTAEVVFTIFNDDIVELDEQFTLTIDTVDNGTKTDGLIDDGLGGTLTVYDQTTITIVDNDTATITFVETDLTVAEDVATGYVEYTVHISNAVENDVQFFVTSADGTSLVVDNASDENTDDDYTSVNELVTFTNSITPAADQTFQVFITDDNKLELDEIFNLYMNSLTAGGLESKITLGSPVSNPAQVTITDEDTAVISFVSDDLNVTEDDGATVTFNIQIDDGSGGAITLAKDVSFYVSTADGTSSVDRNATVADNDYTAKTEQFTFAGSADADLVTGIQNFVITINNDDKLELDEVFNVFMSQLAANGLDSKITLSHPITEPDSNNWAQATITDELDTANITFLNSSITVNEQAGAIALLTVQIDKAIAENVSFDLFTQDGTATDELIDDDYSSDRQTFTFLGTPDTDVVPGVKTFVVNITNDDKLELDEIFNVLMDSLSANGLDSRINLDGPADVTIKDLDTAFISFVNNDVFVDEEAGSVTFNVYISNAIAVDVGFDLTTKDGTPPLPAGSGIATDESLDDDYKFKTQSFTFTGTPDTDNVPSAQAFTVTITPDEKVELDELFNVFIDNLNANGLDSRITLGADATGIIRNNDSAIITVDPVISGGVNEGSGTGTTDITFNVNISKAIDTNVSFFLSTLDNTATVADNDYIPVLNQLYTFLGSPNSDVVPGQQTFTVQIAQDKKVELDELFNVIATNLNASGRNVTLGLPAAGTIINDDSATVTINNVSKLESEGNFVFTATLSNPVDSNVSVEVYTQHGTGLVTDSDYNAVDPLAPIILNFTPNGALTQNFTITVNDDNLVEGDEFFSTILANLDAALRNVSIINGTDQGHIRDNDSAKLSITPVIDTENHSPFQFLVQLSNPVDVAITVDASTIDGTATSPNDYQGISGQTLTFGPGVTQVPLNITVFNDIFTESPETFEVILDNLVPNGRAVFLTSVESLSSVATSDAAVAVDVVGNYAYVADRDGGLQIYNIANPAAPFHVGEFDFNNQGIAQAIDVVGNLAYLAVGEAGLQIINIANPAAPVFVGSIATPARARGVQVIGNLAYVADDSGNGGGLQIIDVTNPAAPSILGSFGVSTPGGLAGGVEVIGNVAYLTDGNNGLQIVNVTDSSNPTLIKNVLTPGGAAIGLDVVGNYAFVANREGGLQVIDISTPATASIVGTLNTPGVATGVQVDGNFAYVADGATGLQVVDITNPTSPILINTFDTPSSARSLFVNGTLAFVADTFSGLQILEFFPSTTATGTILDPSGPPLTGTASPNTTISTSIVKSQTTTDANGETGSVPESEDWVDEWDSFWVEVWGTTTDGSGITGGSFDLEYNTDFFTATAIEFGSAFGNSTSSSIDDQTGIVSGISGQNGVGTLGSSKQVLLARVKFESLADDGVAIDTVAGFLGPHNLGIRVINAQLDVAGTGAVTASVATAPTTDLWAVPFDLDDSGVVDFKDLLKFSSFYGTSVVNASSGLAWSLDFDKSGQINFKDLTFLATNYNRSKASGQSVIFPPNFPQEWYGSSITTDGDDSLNDLINAAVDEWKTATGNQDLSVQVVVTDLGGQQLGEGHILELDENGIPVKGRVYIDDDAAGLGWYSSIEGLSFDSNGEAISGSAADGHYDLYTVLLHEIGHAAGFTTGYSAYADHVETSGSGQVQFVSWDLIAPLTDDGLHIDENFYPDDLMGEFLDPSVRKSISTLDVRILQAAYADAAGAVISPLSAPLTGAGLDPTPLMTSAPVVDAPAATTRTKQSVGVAPAPALEPASEPTTVETASDWGYTSLTVQDSVLNLDQSSGLDQLVGSLLDNSYETDQLLTNDFESLESDGYDLGFEFEDNQDLNAGFELETAGEEVDDLFADWSGPLI